MRCLLLHSEDDPLSAAWPRHNWDRVVDMGIASPTSYQALTKVLGCKVERCPPLDAGDFAKLRRMIAFGMGRLVDRQGLDWWELLTLLWVDRFTELLRLDRVMTRLNRATALFVGSGHQARILQLLACCPVTFIPAASKWTRRRVALSSLRPRQILEILGDKYDGSYRLRRFVAPPKVRSKMPVVILPSAYGNASRTALSYAEALPDIQFLLVATRQSGWTPQAANVSCTRLAAYTASDPIHDELQGLLSSWNDLLADLARNRELAILRDAGCFDSVPSALREGLGVRNCWLKVFEDEPLRSVL